MQLQAQMETGEQELLSYPQLVEEEQLCQKMETNLYVDLFQ